MKKRIIGLLLIVLCVCVAGCHRRKGEEEIQKDKSSSEEIVIGFSQLGAESDWRSANTESMQSTFTRKNGYELIFDDGQQKQSNQITAIRKFIQQEVDYIVLAPVTESGWDTVLREAKDAGIPVIIVDRMVDVEDDNLFVCWVGSDFELEAKKTGEWLHEYLLGKDIEAEEINIVNIQGTMGASAQIGRTQGLREIAEKYGWNILEEKTGDFTQAKGREVMEEFLNKYEDINVVYCENDNEAFGAIEAIEKAGKTVGDDIENGEIMVISFDGVKKMALQYVYDGKIACIGECNPLHGPRVQAIIETIEEGKIPDKFTFVDEQIFSANADIKQIQVEDIWYEVTQIEKMD